MASRGVRHGWPGPGSHEPCRPWVILVALPTKHVEYHFTIAMASLLAEFPDERLDALSAETHISQDATRTAVVMLAAAQRKRSDKPASKCF